MINYQSAFTLWLDGDVMSIRAIDMQVIIPKATEVGAQQNNLAHQGTLQQQQFAEQMEKAAQVRQQQVQSVEKGQGGKVERDNKKENSNSKRGASDFNQNHNAVPQESLESENSEQGIMPPDPVLGHIIDIKT
ncbi:hypothetical protein [Sporomusa sp. KB1]|uniref:hypothetical protein n=1 Tax=Sporomusa sp. KB1 TaxID=943346 RepID=UPI0011ADD52D|nr:hypothetical protein [Sporomusa sp. KB1]TWH48625.1 hypothetical protein Salpa_4793 [Sporomusa sp. KB1]